MTSDSKITYASYLKLGEGYQGEKVNGLLDCVDRLSKEPEEHLFITVHHGFEVWFKQIIFDMDRVREMLNMAINNKGNLKIRQKALGELPKLIGRSRDLFRLLLGNFDILETLTQLSFHNFREKLTGGSGFQSLQFRLIENKFGLQETNRKNPEEYKTSFKDKQLEVLEASKTDTVFDLIEMWLEQILDDFNATKPDYFENLYLMAVKRMDKVEDETMKTVYQETKYNQKMQNAKENKLSCLSYKAFLGALLLHQYQEEPEYRLPYSIITLILDFDQAIMSWRARHVNMVHRMIGGRTGTGGTTGVAYLTSTVDDRYKVFLDLFNMATYVLPSKYFLNQTI